MTPTLTLIVLRCADLEESALFYRALGLKLKLEQHGSGLAHYSCVLGSTVVELYPANAGRDPPARLGLAVDDPLGAAQRALYNGGLPARSAATKNRAVVLDPDGNTVELVVAPESAPGDSAGPSSPAAKARLAHSVAEARGILDVALQGRRWPAQEFRLLRDAVLAYTKACAGDELIDRAVASSVSGLREYLEMKPGRVPANAVAMADRLETMLLSDYDPHFEGDEPPDL
jgi:lactoylglutathione lyase